MHNGVHHCFVLLLVQWINFFALQLISTFKAVQQLNDKVKPLKPLKKSLHFLTVVYTQSGPKAEKLLKC